MNALKRSRAGRTVVIGGKLSPAKARAYRKFLRKRMKNDA
jgi:hypothetical protein